MTSSPSPPHNSLTYQFPLSSLRSDLGDPESDLEELQAPSSPPLYNVLPSLSYSSSRLPSLLSSTVSRKTSYNQFPVLLERKNSLYFNDEDYFDSEDEEEYEKDLREKEARRTEVDVSRSNKLGSTHSYRNFNNIPARSKPSSPPPSSSSSSTSTPLKSTLTLRSSTSTPLTTSNNTSWTLAETRILKDAVKYASDNNIMSWKNVVVIMGRNKEGIKITKTSEQVCNKFWKLRGKGEIEADVNDIPTEFEKMDFSPPTAVVKEEKSTTSKSKRRLSFTDDVIPLKVQKSTDDSSVSTLNSSSFNPLHSTTSTPIPLSTSSSTSLSYQLPTVKKRTPPKPWTATEILKLTKIIQSFNHGSNGDLDNQGRIRTWELVSNLLGGDRNAGMCCTKYNSLMRDERARSEEEKLERFSEGEGNDLDEEAEEGREDNSVRRPLPTSISNSTSTSTSTSYPTPAKRINKRWTPTEIFSLTSIVNEYDTSGKLRLWKNIASELNSGRSAGQCSDKWRGITNKRNGIVKVRSSSSVGGAGRRGSTGSGGVGGSGGNSRSGSGRKRVKKEFTDFSSQDSEDSGDEEFESDEEALQVD